MGYVIGFVLIAFGIHTLSVETTSLGGWATLAIGVVILAHAINKPKSEKLKGNGDGYRSGSSDYTGGGE